MYCLLHCQYTGVVYVRVMSRREQKSDDDNDDILLLFYLLDLYLFIDEPY